MIIVVISDAIIPSTVGVGLLQARIEDGALQRYWQFRIICFVYCDDANIARDVVPSRSPLPQIASSLVIARVLSAMIQNV